MRLVLKEKNLQEEKIGDKFFLYHATVTKPDLSNLHSFRKGVSSGKSIGMAATQGKGFYLFQDKKTTIDRLNSEALVNTGGGYLPFDNARDGYKLLVTISTDDLDPTKFNIDSEISIVILLQKVLENIDEISKIKLPFKMEKSSLRQGALKIGNKRNDTGRGGMTITPDNAEGNQYIADILGENCTEIEKQNPALWNKIEREMFQNAEAIKYVGAELIKPEKLEILNDSGKLIDVTSKDP